MNISDLITPRTIGMSWEDPAANRLPYLGTDYFMGARVTPEMKVSWIKGSNGLPIMLAPSTEDSNARFRGRLGIERFEAEAPLFREGYHLNEKALREIARVENSDDPYLKDAMRRVYDDTNNLIRGARVVPEAMIWQLLGDKTGTPGINIVADGVNYTYNYDPDGSWKEKNFISITTGKWNDPATADPMTDMQTAIRMQKIAHGSTPRYAVMNTTTFTYLMKAESMQNYILSQNSAATVLITEGVVKNAVAANLGLTILIDDGMYVDANGQTKNFVEDDIVILLPEGRVGDVVYVKTTEEMVVMGTSAADVYVVENGIAITTVIEPHPPRVDIYASMICLPTFERMNEVVTMKVV